MNAPRILACAIASSLVLTVASGGSGFDVQGHRGARGLLPENTLPAFRRAIELGVDTLELDLGVTRDGVLVVSHDPMVNAAICTGADGRDPLPNTAIHGLSLEQLKTFDCGAKRNPAFASQTPVPGTRVPTLQEVFDLVKSMNSGVRLNAETKITPDWERMGLTPDVDSFVGLVVGAIRRNGLEDRVSVQSFDFRTLVAVKKLEPRLVTVALVTAPDEVNDPLRAMKTSGASVFSPNFSRLTEETLRLVHGAGYRVIPWTVDAEADMVRLIGWGVDGIISDYPDVLVRVATRLGKR